MLAVTRVQPCIAGFTTPATTVMWGHQEVEVASARIAIGAVAPKVAAAGATITASAGAGTFGRQHANYDLSQLVGQAHQIRCAGTGNPPLLGMQGFGDHVNKDGYGVEFIDANKLLDRSHHTRAGGTHCPAGVPAATSAEEARCLHV